tara:strand:- start:835 stop:1077 length:243 start_codon:yes stop_codon:yes gene_type:complete
MYNKDMENTEATATETPTDLTDATGDCPKCDATGRRGQGRCRSCGGFGYVFCQQLAGFPEDWATMTPAEQHAAVAARAAR